MASPSRRTLLTTGGLMLATSSSALAATQAAERAVKNAPPIPPAPPAKQIRPDLDSVAPLPTDSGDLGAMSFSFANARTEQTAAGWIRSIGQRDLPIARTLSASNMRLQAGAIRTTHWQDGAEWGFVQDGAVRISSVDQLGRRYEADLQQGDIWFLPQGFPRAMQGLAPAGCTVLIAHTEGHPSTLSLLDWMRHTPTDVLARDLGTDAAVLHGLPEKDAQLIAAAPPTGPVEDHSRQRQANNLADFHFPLMSVRPIDAKGGRMRIADMNNFRASTAVSASWVELQPGGLRELHFHPHANELLMVLSGTGRMTAFAGGQGANTFDLQHNSVAYVPRLWGHYIENIGSEPMRFLEILDNGEYRDISLKNCLANMPAGVLSAQLGIDAKFLHGLDKDKTPILPV